MSAEAGRRGRRASEGEGRRRWERVEPGRRGVDLGSARANASVDVCCESSLTGRDEEGRRSKSEGHRDTRPPGERAQPTPSPPTPMSSRTLRSLFPLSTLLRCPNPSRAARSLLAAAPHLPGRRLLAVSPSTSRRTPSEHGPRISNLRRSPRQILATPQREAAPNDGDVLVEVPDDPEGVLKGSQAELLLSNAALIVTRQ